MPLDPYVERLRTLVKDCKSALQSTEEGLRELAMKCTDREASDHLVAQAASIQDFLTDLKQ